MRGVGKLLLFSIRAHQAKTELLEVVRLYGREDNNRKSEQEAQLTHRMNLHLIT